MNNFIISCEGFLQDFGFDTISKERTFTWTKNLRNAKALKSKAARELIEKNSLNAFVWNPYAEEPTLNKWRVVRREQHYDFFNEENHEVLEWLVNKVTMESKSDVNFLTSKNTQKEILYDSFEEATIVCNEKNNMILSELNKKMGIIS